MLEITITMGNLQEIYPPNLTVHSRIKVYDDYATVKYIGEVIGYSGTWIGVEWDNINRGKHNGSVDGIKYFDTKYPTSGSMIRPSKICKFESVEEAIKTRYLKNSLDQLDDNLIQEVKDYCHASVFEIVGMEKIAKQLGRTEDIISITVAYTNVSFSGILTDLTNLSDLNLTATLISNWKTVSDITKQLPSLRYLNLSCNRLESPANVEIQSLKCCFQHLQHINLSKCGLSSWSNILHIAQLWPFIQSLSLQQNDIKTLSVPDCNEVFTKLNELDLHSNIIQDFDEVCKLGNLNNLASILLMDNLIEEIALPYCCFDKKLNLFPSLENINLNGNTLINHASIFNELDKLPSLRAVSASPTKTLQYEEMCSSAVSLMSNLMVFNKSEITSQQRRGAEYELWKKYSADWQKAENNASELEGFYEKCRCYAALIKKYGSPAQFIVKPSFKQANFINIRIVNTKTGESFNKKVPSKISVQTLRGLVIKYFKVEHEIPVLKYVDSGHLDLIVDLDNLSKNLDFYSIQDGDTVVVEWQHSE